MPDTTAAVRTSPLLNPFPEEDPFVITVPLGKAPGGTVAVCEIPTAVPVDNSCPGTFELPAANTLVTEDTFVADPAPTLFEAICDTVEPVALVETDPDTEAELAT